MGLHFRGKYWTCSFYFHRSFSPRQPEQSFNQAVQTMKIQNHKLAAHESLITQKPSHPTFLLSAQMSVRASTSTPSDGGSVNLKFLPAQIVFLVFERCPLAPPPPPERPSSEVVADEEHRRLFISRGCGALVPACLLGFHRRLTYHYLICLVRALHDGPPPSEISAEVLSVHPPLLFLLHSDIDPNELEKKASMGPRRPSSA